jgi:hypothetical protein
MRLNKPLIEDWSSTEKSLAVKWLKSLAVKWLKKFSSLMVKKV